MAVQTMAIEDPKDLDVTILNSEKVILVHVVGITFSAAVLHILKLFFVVTFEVLQNIFTVQDFFRIVKQNFVVPLFLRV